MAYIVVTDGVTHREMSPLNSEQSRNKLFMSVTPSVSHSAIGPYVAAEVGQLKASDSAMHSATAARIVESVMGENVVCNCRTPPSVALPIGIGGDDEGVGGGGFSRSACVGFGVVAVITVAAVGFGGADGGGGGDRLSLAPLPPAHAAYATTSSSSTQEGASGLVYVWHSSSLRTAKPSQAGSASHITRQPAPPVPSPAGCLAMPWRKHVGWVASAYL